MFWSPLLQAALPDFRDTYAGTHDAYATAVAVFPLLFLAFWVEMPTFVLFGSLRFPKQSEDMRLSSMATIPSFAATPGLHGERCRFNRASVTRDPTVCKKGPAIPKASDHFLVLGLILRATIPNATFPGDFSLRPSWRRWGTWRPVGSSFDCATVAA